MPIVCTGMSLVCHLYVTRMYSYVIRMSLLCVRKSSVCTRMPFVCHSYVLNVIRMPLVCTRMSFVCHSYVFVNHLCVLVCHSYITRMYSYVIRMSFLCTRMSFLCHSYVVLPWTIDSDTVYESVAIITRLIIGPHRTQKIATNSKQNNYERFLQGLLWQSSSC